MTESWAKSTSRVVHTHESDETQRTKSTVRVLKHVLSLLCLCCSMQGYPNIVTRVARDDDRLSDAGPDRVRNPTIGRI